MPPGSFQLDGVWVERKMGWSSTSVLILGRYGSEIIFSVSSVETILRFTASFWGGGSVTLTAAKYGEFGS